jgi:tight adherence protein B
MALLVFLSFLFGAGAVIALYYFAISLPGQMQQRRLDARLEEVTRPVEEQKTTGPTTLVKDIGSGPLPGLDRLVANTTKGSAMARWLDQSGAKVTVSGVLFIALLSAALVSLALGIVAKAPWGFAAGAALGFAAPFVVLRIKRRRRLNAFEEQFPEALDLIARALKAGHAFATGLKMVADETDEPVGPEFRKAFDEQNFGLPLKDALDNLTLRIPLLDVRFFATAVMIQRETGGNLSEILENLAHVVRERFKILRQVRVYTAHGRLTGYVLLALPAFLGVALMFINPEHMNLLFREKLGQQMIMAAIVMQIIGYLWIKKVIKIEV